MAAGSRRQISGIAVRAVEAQTIVSRTREASPGILGIDQTCRQGRRLGTAKLSLGVQLINKAHDTGLLFGGKAFDLVDNLRRSHDVRLIRVPRASGDYFAADDWARISLLSETLTASDVRKTFATSGASTTMFVRRA